MFLPILRQVRKFFVVTCCSLTVVPLSTYHSNEEWFFYSLWSGSFTPNLTLNFIRQKTICRSPFPVKSPSFDLIVSRYPPLVFHNVSLLWYPVLLFPRWTSGFTTLKIHSTNKIHDYHELKSLLLNTL